MAAGTAFILIMENMTREEFKQLLKDAVREVISENTANRQNTKKEWLSLSEAVECLAELGYNTTAGYIYQLRSRDAIPYARTNGKLSFSRAELTKWVDSQRTFDSTASRRNAAKALSESANRHLRRGRAKIA